MPSKRREPSARGVLGGRLRDALFDTSEGFPKVVELDLAQVRPNPHQPRKTVDEEGLRELAASIEQHGLISPIVVKEEDGGHVLVAGQRRFLAHQRLGRETIFAIVTEGNADEIAIIENLQRENLKPLEEAESLAALQSRYGYSLEELAKVVAKAKSTVSELLSLNVLPEPIKADVRTSERPVSKSVLIEVARLGSEPEQLRLWEQIKSGRSTVRAARQQKERGEVRDNLTLTSKMLAAGRSFVRRLEQLPTGDLVSNRDQYLELLELKQRLDDLIAMHAARGKELEEKHTL
jgi:ParB family transcriptional regulator, chromosome partitioning protein